MTTVTKFTNPTAAGAEVHARAELYVSAHGGTYADAVHAALTTDKQLAEAYAQPSSRVTAMKPLRPRPAAPATAPVAQGNPASVDVDRRVQALIAEHPHLDYHEAMGAVLSADPGLKARYAGVQR
jgi:hypothetical protein